MRRPEAFAGFLASAGITRGVHYLLCEDAVPGVPPLVMTDEGQILPLAVKCRDAVGTEGMEVTAIRAVAFSATGRRALVNDLEAHWTGAVGSPWRDPTKQTWFETWLPYPGVVSPGAWIRFDGQQHFFNPIAPEGPLASTRRWPHDPAEPPAPATKVVTLLGEDAVSLDPDGCAELLVTTSPWVCRLGQGCAASSEFVRVTEVGCADEPSVVLSASYEAGNVDAVVGATAIRVQVDSEETSGQVVVRRARIAWRPSTAQ
jgi:hypothetical protein